MPDVTFVDRLIPVKLRVHDREALVQISPEIVFDNSTCQFLYLLLFFR